MKQIILTTPEQLDEIVHKAVKNALPSEQDTKPQKIPDNCCLEEALAFLAENGYKLSKSRLYKMTANKQLPFRYFGRRIVFSCTELLKWIDGQTTPSSNSDQALLAIAESARKKSTNKTSKQLNKQYDESKFKK